MSSERRYLWLAIGLVALLSIVFLLLPPLREGLAPEPRSALVAVQVAGSDVAEVGRISVESGRPFSLHAVLVATDRQGEPVYYTRAPALAIAGEPVDPERLRTWNGSGEIVVLWFTVEGFRPFARVDDLERLGQFHFGEAFRPEWGRGWTIAGSVTPRNDALARGFEPEREVPFGTARYHVRIEKYSRLGDAPPLARYRSPGAAEVLDGTDGPTIVEATLPAGLRRVSAVFGTPQLEPAAESPPALLRELGRWYRQGLTFSRLLVFGGLLGDRGLAWSDVEWRSVDLELAPKWGEIGGGDLLRSGERMVVLYEDHGEAGHLDYADLCFDLAESAAVRRLSEVFTGGGVLEWADLEPEPQSARGDV